jgi:hypothetical protein
VSNLIKIQTVICSVLILLGVVDLLTTVVGVTGKGVIEANPIFAALTQTNILGFIGIKILTVIFTGFMFLGASKMAKAPSSNFVGKYFMTSASIASCFVMTAVVANNVLVLFKIP